VAIEQTMRAAFSSSFEMLDHALSEKRPTPIRAFSRLSNVSQTVASIISTGFGYTQEWEADHVSDLYCLRRFGSAAPLAEAIDRVSLPDCTPIARASSWLTHPPVLSRTRSARSAQMMRASPTPVAVPLTDSTGRRVGTCRLLAFLVAEEERIVSDTVWVPARRKRPGGPDSVRNYPKRFRPDRRQRVFLTVDSLGWVALNRYRSVRLLADDWLPVMDVRLLPEPGTKSGVVLAQSLSAPLKPPTRIREVRAIHPRRERRSTARP
jgi:hypothetical protein